MAAALLGFAIPLIRKIQRWHKERFFEFGSLDLSSMTVQAAKDKLGRKTTRGAKGKPQLTSLIPEVLEDLEESGGSAVLDAVAPKEEVDRRAQALAAVGAPPFRRFIHDRGLKFPERGPCQVLQLNIGLYCNQACSHCHVESSPLRKEMMEEDVVERCLHLLRESPNVSVLDITGGAPELNRGFRRLVEGAAELRDSGARPELRIIDRCNLTVLLEPGQESLPDFLTRHRVDIIASLPSYDAAQTDRQRGRKVFARSIEALRILNSRGYGSSRDGVGRLNLVFNPPGPFLPPKQELLEAKYKESLRSNHGVEFDGLITLANMPVKRFFDHLRKQGTLEGYMDLLVRNFNPDTVPLLMCINTVSVRMDGRIYDCDFNQQLDLTLGKPPLTVFDIQSLDDARLRRAPIATSAHCFGCTATQGSG
eukprot:gnl/TRDRNA2_/TRDRNA2_28029_c0_seq1.p1 gnl/TRDRNA2_/TRDRNA2_28029_c0~~gnl/TRDRNA2_/TRDRNA2_28029_c0_seq1.p1  ORF type:complete len:475 (+),score=90.95 gnl/TRDRNA2_/TRDRNA2_28029_c0_seq1:162-1427(+)